MELNEARIEMISQMVEAAQNDSTEFEKLWTVCGEVEQIEVLTNNEFSLELITMHWELGSQFRFLCCKCQKLSPQFLEGHWEDLNMAQQFVVLLKQEQVPKGLVNRFWEGIGQEAEFIKGLATSLPQERRPEGFKTDGGT